MKFLRWIWEVRKGTKKKNLWRATFNIVALFVIALTVMAPLEPAFAQSAELPASTNTDSATTDTATLGSDQTNIDSSTAQPPTTESTPPPDSSSVSSPATQSTNTISPGTTGDQSANPNAPSSGASGLGTTSNANNADSTNGSPGNSSAIQNAQSDALFTQGSGSPGPGSVATTFFNQSQFKIDKNTGAAQATYPIVIPPGRNNLQPDLDLVYNSQNSQQGSVFGEGWSISTPYIERMNKGGIDTFYGTSTQQYFASSIDGELASTTASSSYIARTENGTFNKYTFSGNQWAMTDKNGIQYVFGSTSDSQQSDPSNASNTYKWMLKQVADTNGNSILYSYFKDSGQIYPSSTIYTNTSSTTGIFEVDFQLASSTDNATSSATGFAVKSNYRVSEIDAKSNGTWVRKYVLGYKAGDNGTTALLGAIGVSGENASGTLVSLPSSTFSYQTQTPGWISNSTWNPLISFTATSSIDDGVRVADVNGDGLPDIVQGYTNSVGATSFAAYVNNGADWTVSSTWNPPISFTNNGVDQGVRIADVNDDGLPDIIQGFEDAGGGNHYAAYVNSGNGWVASSTWNPPVIFSNNGVDTGARIADVNGDGLPDLVQAYSDSGGTVHYAAYINNGSGWISNVTWNPPTLFIASGTIDVGTRLADVNGDGLPDIIQAYADAGGTSHYATFMNTGSGWNASSTSLWNPPITFTANGVDNGVRTADVNGDGLPDLIQAYTDSGGAAHYTASLNSGAGWSSASTWNPPIPFMANGTDLGVRVLDVDGDGLPDIIQAYTDSGGVTHYSAYTNNNKFRADLLNRITYPQGGSSSISYQSILQITDDLGNVLNGVPYPVYIVSRITNNDGSQNVSTLNYVYYGGTYYTNGPFDHEFAGFTAVKDTDGAGNVTKTYYDTSNGNNSSTGQYADNFWKIGKPYRIENYDGSGNLYKAVITKWDSANLGGNAAFVFPDQTLEMDYDGLVTHSDLAEAYTYNTSTGNKTQKIQWGQVTGSSNGTFTDTGSDEYITNYSYASSTTSNVIGRISDEILTNQSSTKIQETQYYYDGLALGNIGAGNLTKQQDWKASSTYVTTAQSTYNSFGLVTQALDPRNNTTTYAYDSFNLYPATTTNALSQSTGYQYDYSTGKPTQTTDPNGDVSRTVYDGLGRTLATLQPDPNTSSTLVTSTLYAYTDTANAVSVHESDYLSATTTVDTYSYYDGLGRLNQARKSSENSGTYKATDRSYNSVGLLQKLSLPYFASGTAETAATSTSALFTSYAYDPLARILSTTNAVGTVSNAYANWKTTITDARGNPKDEYADAYGNLVRVDEHNGSSTYSTYYAYDGLKDLTNITDALGNIRNFTYDGLGRRLTAQDLHPTSSATFGTWSYTYDDAGDLTQQVDPKNQTTTYNYDNLNRVASESFGGQTQITYTYDTCTQGIGRLCVASSSDAITSDAYSALGQLTQEGKTIASATYTTSYAYDWQGNQLSITNPDNSQVQYTYNTAGLVESVKEKESGGGSFTSIVSDFDYSPMDQVAVETYPNGMVAKNIYDPLQLYRLVGKVTTDSNVGQMRPMGGGGFSPNGGGGPLAPGGGLITSTTTTENYTGSVASFTVPIGVAGLAITTYGAQGGSTGGRGGMASGTLAVTSGTIFYYGVGQVGGDGTSDSVGDTSGGGGGGMTWFGTSNGFSQGTVILDGAGGGGTGGNWDFSSNNSEPGGAGGFGGGGTGGAAGGGPGAGGGGGGYWGGGGGGNRVGGIPGTQTSGYAAGQGGTGAGNLGTGALGGGGGSGGGLSGVTGGVTYDFANFLGSGGGGGGSSFTLATSSLTSTSTDTGVNSGNGKLQITEYPANTVYAPYLTSQSQYHLDGTTALSRGSSTTEGGVVFKGMLNSSGTLGLQLQAEVEPIGKNFTNIPNVTSTPFMAPNQIATTTFYGLNGSYHWQIQVVDVFGNTSGWQRFSSSTYTTDFIITSQVPPTIVTSTYIGTVSSLAVPSDVALLMITAYGAQGGSGSLSNGLAGSAGANGGDVIGTTHVTPSTTLYYCVGQQGQFEGGGSGNAAGGFCGGGQGGSGNNAAGNSGGGGGGGMTWLASSSTFASSSALLVAGGGGGGGGNISAGVGGNGGGLIGGNGDNSSGTGGGGGTQSAGGAYGGDTNCGGFNRGSGTAGSSGSGGVGENSYVTCGGGGGGGGGYYGGGGGNNGVSVVGPAGGGGGSSYFSNGFTNTSTASGVNTGNGYISITEYHNAPIIGSLNQYHLDGMTSLNDGSSTNESGVVFGSTLTSNTTTSIQLQVEVEPVGVSFTNVANVTSSGFVVPGTFATTSFSGASGAYHWQMRGVDTQGDASVWLPFNQNASATDFIINRLSFTFPTSGTTTSQFSNWLMSARNVTSSHSYQVNVAWGLSQPNQATSSINASGTQLLYGVSVPKQLFSGDYSDTGDPVAMVASSSLYDITGTSTFVATTSVNFYEDTIPGTSGCTSSNIQCIAYTYDANGNITQIVDNSASNAAKTVNYTYDSLNRLIVASSSNAVSGSNYRQTFTYDALGNILNGPLGTYTYGSTPSSTYADPDAATSISNSSSTGGGGVATITLDATSTNMSVGYNAGPVTKSWSHTMAASSTVLMLSADILQDASGTGTVASATWKGTSLTKIKSALSGTMDSEIWYLAAPSTGSGTLSVTVTGATDAIKLGASSFIGVATSSPIDASSTATGTSGNPSSSITTATSSDLIIDTLSRFSTSTATTNRTSLYSDNSSATGGGGGTTSTPAFVQGAINGTANSLTLASSVTSGDLILVGVTTWNQTISTSSIHDSKGNTYTRVLEAVNSTSSDHAAIFYAKNVTGGSSFTVSSTVSDVTLSAQEYSGIATSSPLDVFASRAGTSASPTSPNVTSTVDHELYFGLAWSAGDGDSWTATSSFTLREQDTNNATQERQATEDKTVTVPTSTAAKFLVTTSDNWIAAIATFKPLVTGTSTSNSTGTLAAASYQIATSTGTYSDTYSGSANQNWSMVMAALKPAPIGGSTSSSTIALTYDNNGNLLTYGTSTTNTWNYRNQLTQSVNSNGTSSYAYDYQSSRVKLVENGATTIFPTKYYNVQLGTSSSSVKHIFANGLLVATIQNASSTGGGGGGTSTISLDATSTSITNGFNAGPITKSWTHTVGASSTILVLTADLWQDTGGTGSVASATWKGTPLTKVTSTRSVNIESEIWYLASPSVGSGTIAVTVTGATDAIKLGAESFTGTATSSPLDASSVATGTSGNPSVSLTTATSSDVIIATLSRYSTTTATSSRTNLYRDASGSTLAAGSYQVTTSTGTFSDTYSGSAAQDWSMVAAAFKPGTTGGGGGGGSVGSTTIDYVLTDHLGGTNVITNSSGTSIVETLDYYPYGSIRIDNKINGTDERRKFIGQINDAGSGLDYFNARYYSADRGQFISEDPTFLGDPLAQDLTNPQSLNSYSYANDNPINRADPSGRFSLLAALQSIVSSLQSLVASLASFSGSGSGGARVTTPQTISPSQIPALPRTSTWDPISDTRIRTLDPRVQQPAVNFINNTQDELGIKLRVPDGGAYRSIEEQNRLYAQGRTTPGPKVTKSQGGESYHNYGRAVDVVIMNNGSPDWSSQITPDIAAIAAAQGFEWGGNWKGDFQDFPHFQMTFGQSIQDLISRTH